VIFDVPHGEGQKRLMVSDEQQFRIVSSNRAPANLESIARSLTSPTELGDFDSFISTRKELLVVVNDHTRPAPTAVVLSKLNLKGKDVMTIVADGTHRSPNQQEMQETLAVRAPHMGEDCSYITLGMTVPLCNSAVRKEELASRESSAL